MGLPVESGAALPFPMYVLSAPLSSFRSFDRESQAGLKPTRLAPISALYARCLRFGARTYLGTGCAAHRFRVPFFRPAFLAAAAFFSCPFTYAGAFSHGLTSAAMRRRLAAVALADKGCVAGIPYLAR